ncbi:SIMPL domain-containing protein [Pseudonocardia xinjiangensis]|uniref:SIMPL domain-containing protein n=1 Tax=Pseudonocardia xinjiangensis TaxID=75289 RepID=UPI003D915E6C
MTETPIDPHSPEIVTEGTGHHEQLGDRAELDVSFTGFAGNRADAVRELGRRVAAAEPALELPGLVVRSRQFWVHNEWQGDRVVGCRAGEDIALMLTDTAALEEVLSALVGAEPTGLHGPRWALADPAAAQREAQRRAVEDARQRAEGYATALNGRLGALRRLSDAPSHGGHVALAARESGGPDVRELGLEPEPVRVTARCLASWTLLT